MTRALHFLAPLLVVVWFTGCVSVPAGPAISFQIGERPELGVRTAADVGDVVYTKYDYVETQGAQLVEDYRDGFLLGEIGAPAGTFLEGRGSGSELEYCSRESLYRGPGTDASVIVCFADWNGDQRFELVRVPKLKFGNWKTLNEPGPRYRESASTGSHGGFRKELIYQGVSGNVIRLAYREYAENMARPAYQQDVTYNLEPGQVTEVRFQGALLEIFDANNNEIDYRVVKGFDD
ncbi:MAG TPA: hypothetical protein VNB06_21725 [Thermoanaerobaculia bacterium]|nr:hypothetical protein [Thermoanaerobaculia bacterium]